MRDVISAPAPGLDLRRCRGAACPSRASHPNSATRRHHREGLKVCGLAAGGNRIRTIGPAPAKALLGVANRRRRHERRRHLQVQVRDGDAYLERLPVGFPFAVGPRVRIRLPPGKSPLRTCCCRAFEPAGSHM